MFFVETNSECRSFPSIDLKLIDEFRFDLVASDLCLGPGTRALGAGTVRRIVFVSTTATLALPDCWADVYRLDSAAFRKESVSAHHAHRCYNR